MAVSGVGGDTLARTGSILELNSNANTGSTSISVPSDATYMVVAVSGFYGGSTPVSTSTGTLTLNSVSVPIVNEVGDGDTQQATKQCLVFFGLASPSVGTQTLAWDWGGTSAPDEGQNITVGFYKGQNTTTPIKATGGELGNTTAQKTTGSLTAASGDISICVGDVYTGGSFTWGNAGTKQADNTYNSDYFEWLEGTPTGNVTVTMTATDNYNVLGCIILGD